jgi:hypothetical protein
MLQALLHPILYVLDHILEDPYDTILTVVPNLAYFIADNNGGSLLQASVDRILFALNSVVGSVTGEADLVSIDVTEMIDTLLRSLNLGINIDFMIQLRVGTLTPYTSLNGHSAFYVSVNRYDSADLLTTVLRQLFSSARNSTIRNGMVDLIADVMGLGSFGRFVVRTSLNVVFGIGQIIPGSQAVGMRLVFTMMRLLMALSPVISWFVR